MTRGLAGLLGALLLTLALGHGVGAQTPPSAAILQNAAVAAGPGTTLLVLGYQLVLVQITTSGSPTFTVNFEGAIAPTPGPPPLGATFAATSCVATSDNSTATTATAAGLWRCNVAGFTNFQARISGYSGTGSVTVLGSALASGQIGTITTQGTTNITQFGGTNLSTGTGTGGLGIPRVTVSSDSALAANQSVNVNQFGGASAATGQGTSGSGVPRVTLSWDATSDPFTHRVGSRITTATTTTLLAGVASTQIRVYSGSLCVDADGVSTNLTLQDSTPTNLIGTSVVYHLSPGQCLALARSDAFYYNPTAVATGLQLVTSAAGPVNVYLELRRE